MKIPRFLERRIWSGHEDLRRGQWKVYDHRSMARTRRQLEARIERIKRAIDKLDRIHPGSLSQQYNVCGNAQCRCKAKPPKKHGPYHQVSFTWRGKNTSRFVRKDDLARVKRDLGNYQRLRDLTDEWIELSIELAKLDKSGQAA